MFLVPYVWPVGRSGADSQTRGKPAHAIMIANICPLPQHALLFDIACAMSVLVFKIRPIAAELALTVDGLQAIHQQLQLHWIGFCEVVFFVWVFCQIV